jgi:hypothetical protein
MKADIFYVACRVEYVRRACDFFYKIAYLPELVTP